MPDDHPSNRLVPPLDGATLHELVRKAQCAHDKKDYDSALATWSSFVQADPADPQGHIGMAKTLAAMSRTEEAAAVLRRGLERCPTSDRLATELAWLAHNAADWPEADRRWARVRQDFPNCLQAYTAGGAALRALGRLNEAEAVLAEGLRRWSDALSLLAEHAALADARGNRAEAARRWGAVRERHPNEALGYLRDVRASRAAGDFDAVESLLKQATERFPANADAALEYAQIAQQRGLSAQALKRWEAVITSFPGLKDGYIGAAHALNDLGRFPDARNVLQPALRMFPNAADMVALDAWTTHYMGDFAAAIERWTRMRERFPKLVAGYIGGIASLQGNQRAADATALLDDARQRFPGDLHIAVEYARVPQQADDWDEALERWVSVCARFPDAAPALSGYAQALSKLKRWDEAERTLEKALAYGKADAGLLRSYAECATQRGDWPSADARWRHLIERFPEKTVGWTGLAEMLRDSGGVEEAWTLLTQATARFPDSIELDRQMAQVATLRRDWPVALRLWDELKRKHPRHNGVIDGIKQALWQAQQDLGVARSEGSPVPFAIPPSLLATGHGDDEATTALQRLFLRFESIGDTCEFGIVQRRFGAEPISLLRWASTSPEHLLTALNTRFAGVGEPEHTVIAVIHGEYTTRDTRYHMFSHTFTPETAEPIEKFTKQHLRRMQYLRGKLLDDLASGDKIFVYKCLQGLRDAQARAIHKAICAYGADRALLCVKLGEAEHEPGTIEMIEDGLFIGYIDRFSTVDINVDAWVSLCQNVSAAWKARCASRRTPTP